MTHRFGGHVALRAVHRHPDIASKLVLTAAAPWFADNKAATETSDDATVGGFSEEFADSLSQGLGDDYAGTN